MSDEQDHDAKVEKTSSSDISSIRLNLVTSKQDGPSALMKRISNFLPTIHAANQDLDNLDQSRFQIDVKVDDDNDEASSESDDANGADEVGGTTSKAPQEDDNDTNSKDNRAIEMTIAMGQLDESTTNLLASNDVESSKQEGNKRPYEDGHNNGDTNQDWKDTMLRIIDKKETSNETEHIRAISTKTVKRKKLIEEVSEP